MDKYENGKDIPNTDRIIQYAYIGKVSLNFLIYGVNYFKKYLKNNFEENHRLLLNCGKITVNSNFEGTIMTISKVKLLELFFQRKERHSIWSRCFGTIFFKLRKN